MPNIKPVSDLRNYGEVLRDVAVGQPVFLTKNGHGRYAVLDMEEYRQYEKLMAIDNGPTENFWGIVKSEMYYLNEFHDETALREAIASYMNFYATERIQDRFDGKTPAEVRAKALASDSPEQYPIPVNKRIQKYKAKYAA